MVFFGKARWEDARRGARRPRRLQAAREPADHAAPAGRARRPGDRRRHHPAAVVRAHRPIAVQARAAGSSRSSSSARRDITGTWADDNKYAARWLLAIARALRSASSPRSLVYAKQKVKAGRAGDPRRGLVLRPGGQRLHGRPGPQGRSTASPGSTRTSSTAPSTAPASSSRGAAGEIRKGADRQRAQLRRHRRRRRRAAARLVRRSCEGCCDAPISGSRS